MRHRDVSAALGYAKTEGSKGKMAGDVGTVQQIRARPVNDLGRPQLNVGLGCRADSDRMKRKRRQERLSKATEITSTPVPDVAKDKNEIQCKNCSASEDDREENKIYPTFIAGYGEEKSLTEEAGGKCPQEKKKTKVKSTHEMISNSSLSEDDGSASEFRRRKGKLNKKWGKLQDALAFGSKADEPTEPVVVDSGKKKEKKGNKKEDSAKVEENSTDADQHKNKKRKKKRKKKGKKKPEISKPSSPAEVVDSETAASKDKAKPGCFDWIKSLKARIRERQRARKLEAIATRKSTKTPVERLLEYERRKARGGVAFTVQLDDRPMRKPVLPPIRPHSGANKRDPDAKLRLAEERRLKKLEKKKQASKEHDRKKAECNERKNELDSNFRGKALATVRDKQDKAWENRNDLHRRQLRAPSTLPPLRVAPRTRFADAQPSSSDPVGKGTAEPDRHVFDC